MYYVCPKDQTLLEAASPGLKCNACLQKYEETGDGILLLDIVLSEEALAFDEQQQGVEVLAPAQIENSITLARRFLDVAGHRSIPKGANILDVGCGKGELTIGLLEVARDARVFGFDHSSESLRVLGNTAAQLGHRGRLELSAQDAAALGYPAKQFDLIFGNAVLHHILDWELLVSRLFHSLRDGGTATFAEPFFEGYYFVMSILKMAAREYKLLRPNETIEGAGLLDFIINNIGDRTKHRKDLAFLSQLTDKHLFTITDFQKAAEKLGCRVRFVDYEDKSFYADFLEQMFKAYGIENSAIRQSARSMYQDLTEYIGEEFGTLFSHFKFITFVRD